MLPDTIDCVVGDCLGGIEPNRTTGVNMTRKDYVAIAKAISESGVKELDKMIVARSMAEVFKENNERFDYSRFFEACIQKEVSR